MIAELIFLYCLICNEPSYSMDQYSPVLNHEVRLDLTKDLSGGSYFRLSPYLRGSENDSVEATGAYFELGYQHKAFTVFIQHHSSHRADRKGTNLEYDVVGLKIRLQ